MFVREMCRAGATVEIREYHSQKFNRRGQRRGQVLETTKEEQAKINERNAAARCRRRLNENFRPGDWWVTLTYQRDNRPTPGQARKIIAAFLRKLRAKYKANGQELRYMLATEYAENNPHHHIVLNNVRLGETGTSSAIAELWGDEKLWGAKGSPKFVPLRTDGDYKRLAEYIAKETKQTIKRGAEIGEDEEVSGKRWSCSRNLREPEIEKEIVKEETWKEPAEIPEGYHLDVDTMEYGVSERTGYPYRFYRLIADNPMEVYRRTQERRSA